MSKTITQIVTSTDTFQDWIDTTNDLANTVSVEVVTCNTHANGGLTTGNGYVEGVFGARNLRANTLSGGTVQTPGLLTITSNTELTGNTLIMGDVAINSSDITIGGVSVAEVGGLTKITSDTVGVSTQLITYFDKIVYRGAEYILTIKDTGASANAYQVSKLLIVHDSGNAHVTEYGVVWTNTSLGQFAANANSTHVRTYFTPTVGNTHVSGTVALIEV